MEHPKRAVIYCRVSTKEQVEEGNSLATQEKICKEYAVKNGYEVVQSFIELGESAKTADRTELKKLLAFCTTKKEKINAVIIYRVDRLSRQVEDYAFIKSKLRQSGVTIKSTAEHFEDDPAGRFMENIIANVAQFDNDVRTERSVNGMKEAVREGRYVWRAPLGYVNEKMNGKSNIVPSEHASVIQEAFAEVAKDILPVDVVWQNLNHKWGKENKPIIARSHFYTLVKNELYAGWIIKFGERHKGTFQPLISEALYRRVRHVLEGRKRLKENYKAHNPDFPMRKFYLHPTGLKLTGGWCTGKQKKYPYYFYRLPKHVYSKDTIDNSFIELLNGYELNQHFFGKLLSFVKKSLLESFHEERVSIEFYKNQVAHLREKQNALIEKNLNGILKDDLLKTKLASIDSEIEELELLSLRTNFKNLQPEAVIPLLEKFVKHPGETWKSANSKGRLALQWFYFPEGVIWDGMKCKTPKICSLFKLKELIDNEKSVMVHQGFSGLNNTEASHSLSYIKTVVMDQAFLDTIQNELLELQRIVSDESSYKE